MFDYALGFSWPFYHQINQEQTQLCLGTWRPASSLFMPRSWLLYIQETDFSRGLFLAKGLSLLPNRCCNLWTTNALLLENTVWCVCTKVLLCLSWKTNKARHVYLLWRDLASRDSIKWKGAMGPCGSDSLRLPRNSDFIPNLFPKSPPAITWCVFWECLMSPINCPLSTLTTVKPGTVKLKYFIFVSMFLVTMTWPLELMT